MYSGQFESRPIDLIYFNFFILHAIATLLIDIQAVFFASKLPLPLFLTRLFIYAAKDDPLLSNATVYPTFIWFQSFILLEIIFQLPCFYYGAKGLWSNSLTIYPLLLLYSASSATTTFACLTTLYYTPDIANRTMLFCSYLPFFLVPLYMAFDMAQRLFEIVEAFLELTDKIHDASEKIKARLVEKDRTE